MDALDKNPGERQPGESQPQPRRRYARGWIGGSLLAFARFVERGELLNGVVPGALGVLELDVPQGRVGNPGVLGQPEKLVLGGPVDVHFY
jgi:hypothetical protein